MLRFLKRAGLERPMHETSFRVAHARLLSVELALAIDFFTRKTSQVNVHTSMLPF